MYTLYNNDTYSKLIYNVRRTYAIHILYKY